MPTIHETIVIIGALGGVNVVVALLALALPWDRCPECEHCQRAEALRAQSKRRKAADAARRHHDWLHATYGYPRGTDCPICRGEPPH